MTFVVFVLFVVAVCIAWWSVWDTFVQPPIERWLDARYQRRLARLRQERHLNRRVGPPQ